MIFSVQQALIKAQRYCVYQERSQQEVRDKLYSWGLHRNEVENVISELIGSDFLKEERFATAFAGGKFRIKKWGRNKIRIALEQKKVSEPLINKALKEIGDRDYTKALKDVITSQSKKVAEKDPFKRNYKIASYAIRRGFEPELVWQMVKELSDSEL
jgi:regulatory protein